MADPSTGKREEEITAAPNYDDVDGGRRGTLASLNLNKNLDAKYDSRRPRFCRLSGLHTNINFRVSNPLADIPYEVLMQDVEDFANDKDLTDILPYLKKGALVAQDPHKFEEIEILEDEEREALRQEKAHKWKHPFSLYLTIVVCSIGAAVQ